MPVYQNLSDNDLIALLREGNAAAYTEVYDRYFQLMFVFAFRKLGDEELAKDFVQELFVSLWVKRERLLVEGNLAQYLYISLRSQLFNYFAHQKVQSKYIDFLGVYADGFAAGGSDFAIREKQLSDYIEGQIQKLPAKMRAVFELSRKDGLSNKEIADSLNTSESNVSHQISNALKILKSKLHLLIGLLLV